MKNKIKFVYTIVSHITNIHARIIFGTFYCLIAKICLKMRNNICSTILTENKS